MCLKNEGRNFFYFVSILGKKCELSHSFVDNIENYVDTMGITQ